MFMTRRHLAEIRPRAKHDLRTHGSWFLSDFRRTNSKFFRWFLADLLFSTACCTHQAAAYMNCRPPQAKQSKLQHLAMLPKANDTAVQSTAKGGAKKNRKFYRRRNCNVEYQKRHFKRVWILGCTKVLELSCKIRSLDNTHAKCNTMHQTGFIL